MESLIKRSAAPWLASVTKKTGYVVAGESPGSKFDEGAGATDDSILDEDGFVGLLSEHGIVP